MSDAPAAGGDERHRRPDCVDDATVEAVGKLSEAVEWIERARGRLYDFHQMIGRADLLMGDASAMLAEAGHAGLARLVDGEVVGRNVLEGRWTFQIVEEFEELYYDPVRAVERQVGDELLAGRRHVLEAEMKERRRSAGRPGHESRPPAARGPDPTG